jgi:predicted kinase
MIKVIVISGLPGSGKSTVAENLAKKLAVPVLSVDPIESAIIKSGIAKSSETGLAAYLVAEALASEQLNLGISVIIDAVSAVREARNMWRILLNKYKARLLIIECVLDKELHKKRIALRIRNMHGIPEVTWDDVENRHKEYLPWEDERLVVDTREGIENNSDKVLKYVDAVV